MTKMITRTIKQTGTITEMELSYELAYEIALHHYLDALDIREELKAGYTIETPRCTYKAV